jgi:OTU domain-containing protein 3
MAAHKERFEAFVDDNQGLDRHLNAMRSHGTYGGHLELTAFAQLKVVNVKVVQPGLVYVIEGGNTEHFGPKETIVGEEEGGGPSTSKERRKAKKERMKKKPNTEEDDEEEEMNGTSFPATVYVAYVAFLNCVFLFP